MTPAGLRLLSEIARRAQVAKFTAEAIADGHAPQLELMAARDRNLLALCSRRAGKSSGIVGLMGLDAAAGKPGVQLYFGSTKPAVRLSIWQLIWRPFCERWKLEAEHNDTSMVSRFEHGGIVAFTGTDDVRHVETYLGNKLLRAVIDEAQSQPDSVLRPLVERILPPALSDTGGQLILAGTIPEVPAGVFYELWLKGDGWRKLNWNRFANPHMGTATKQMADLRHYLLTSGRTADDPLVRRDWFGEFVFDSAATGYRYERVRNGYDAIDPSWIAEYDFGKGHVRAAVPHEGINEFAAGIDPGGGDRTSIVVWGWGDHTREVQHVFEWVTPRNTQVSLGEIGAALAIAVEHYPTDTIFWDPGSGSMEIDTFASDYGIPLVRAANKTDFPGQVRRNNDLLIKGWAQVIAGSSLEEDYVKARFDPDARAKGQWRWASQWHPDPSEAARYALQGYFANYTAPAEVVPIELQRRAAAIVKQRKWLARKQGKQRLIEDDEAEVFSIDSLLE